MKQKKTIEDYLKTIYLLLERQETVRGVDIARSLRVSRPTVSVALRELAAEKFLSLNTSHEVQLTEKGRQLAQDICERHHTFQQLLTDACEMEHAVSPKSFAAFKRLAERHRLEATGRLGK